MRILIEGENLSEYLAKCHESFRTGLRTLYNAKCYGEGYDGYAQSLTAYNTIAKQCFGENMPDLIIATQLLHPFRFVYSGLAEMPCIKALICADYWTEAYTDEAAYLAFLRKYDIGLVLSYFKQPVDKWADLHTPCFLWTPPSFDPAIFNDWAMPKRYDVGFLAAGTAEPNWEFYPERAAIHQALLTQQKFSYLWAAHPGWHVHAVHPLVGKGFSLAMNACRIFITTGGVLNNFHAKYVEALASRVCLFATEPYDIASTGLIDGVNYVRIDAHNVLDKLAYYTAHAEEREAIATSGQMLAFERYSCYALAQRLHGELIVRVPTHEDVYHHKMGSPPEHHSLSSSQPSSCDWRFFSSRFSLRFTLLERIRCFFRNIKYRKK